MYNRFKICHRFSAFSLRRSFGKLFFDVVERICSSEAGDVVFIYLSDFITVLRQQKIPKSSISFHHLREFIWMHNGSTSGDCTFGVGGHGSRSSRWSSNESRLNASQTSAVTEVTFIVSDNLPNRGGVCISSVTQPCLDRDL